MRESHVMMRGAALMAEFLCFKHPWLGIHPKTVFHLQSPALLKVIWCLKQKFWLCESSFFLTSLEFLSMLVESWPPVSFHLFLALLASSILHFSMMDITSNYSPRLMMCVVRTCVLTRRVTKVYGSFVRAKKWTVWEMRDLACCCRLKKRVFSFWYHTSITHGYVLNKEIISTANTSPKKTLGCF